MVRNLKINPGEKYNLNLRFGPCKKDINPTPFSVSGGVRQTFTMPATDFGFVFDIYRLDNSFNLIINGTRMTDDELQFEKAAGRQTIGFEDGSRYQEGNVPGIWALSGDSDNPVIRVVISKEGRVSLFGSKSSGGRLIDQWKLFLEP